MRVLNFFFYCCCSCFSVLSFGQGHIDHIKNQPYLQGKLDCDNQSGSAIEERRCANLEFQKSDKQLVKSYIDLLLYAKKIGDKELRKEIIDIQAQWRTFRDNHCQIEYKRWGGPFGGSPNYRSVHYFNCLKELTDNRTNELKSLLQSLKN